MGGARSREAGGAGRERGLLSEMAIFVGPLFAGIYFSSRGALYFHSRGGWHGFGFNTFLFYVKFIMQ